MTYVSDISDWSVDLIRQFLALDFHLLCLVFFCKVCIFPVRNEIRLRYYARSSTIHHCSVRLRSVLPKVWYSLETESNSNASRSLWLSIETFMIGVRLRELWNRWRSPRAPVFLTLYSRCGLGDERCERFVLAKITVLFKLQCISIYIRSTTLYAYLLDSFRLTTHAHILECSIVRTVSLSALSSSGLVGSVFLIRYPFFFFSKFWPTFLMAKRGTKLIFTFCCNHRTTQSNCTMAGSRRVKIWRAVTVFRTNKDILKFRMSHCGPLRWAAVCYPVTHGRRVSPNVWHQIKMQPCKCVTRQRLQPDIGFSLSLPYCALYYPRFSSTLLCSFAGLCQVCSTRLLVTFPKFWSCHGACRSLHLFFPCRFFTFSRVVEQLRMFC